ncbi:hypothetical protein K458DRAFT_450180 [Lentithecium fluviatile CBS 122367]|uniref:Heterokaryon incompatibility domain-containing protein n=1 Tax=Lentithecium fluviatile CBS 122367 TaxID=1168545 RepID=A0A6G1J4B0_9PLEO|nr:hypothetical protein K458DRAFT_450180 [Lentithecium fluviatile CBS 122367]
MSRFWDVWIIRWTGSFLARCLRGIKHRIAGQFLYQRHTFKYQNTKPLRRSQLRLLRLHPARLLSDKIPYLTLEVHDLAIVPPYTALSYTWGPPLGGTKERYEESEQQAVSIGGQLFYVNPNLYDAIAYLVTSSTEARFWADAICINQQDNEEKSMQLSIMGDIYRLASRTLIWLGHATPNTARAAELITSLSAAARREVLRITSTGVYGEATNPFDPSAFERYGMPALTPQDWHALGDIFGRRYFGRVWMMQEVAMSRNLVVVCGDVEIEWEHIGIVATFLGVANFLVGLLLHSTKVEQGQLLLLKGAVHVVGLFITRFWVEGRDPELLEAVRRFNWTLSSGEEGGGRGTVLIRFLQATTGFAGTDYRDKVFSCYGLLTALVPDRIDSSTRESATLGGENSQSLGFADQEALVATNAAVEEADQPVDWYRPDYKLSEAEVFMRACRGIIEESGSLNLLALAGHSYPNVVDGLPSWAPDFAPAHPPSIHQPLFQHDALKTLNASKTSHDQSSTHFFEGTKLHVAAIKIGEILRVGNSWTETTRKKLFVETAEMLRHVSPIYPHRNTQSRTEAFWRTLVLDQDLSSRPASADLGRSFRAFFSLFLFGRLVDLLQFGLTVKEVLRLLTAVDDIARSEDPPATFFPDLAEMHMRLVHTGFASAPRDSGWTRTSKLDKYMDDWQAAARGFETVAFHTMQFRRPFVTERGHVGCGPQDIREGDGVWIVAGCPSPLVLRRDGEAWRVVGEAYVHGVMDGEAVSGDVEWGNICLF